MPDKFPPKNSEFRFESFRFSSDVTDCRHAIYHHGCPSCDERDPEGNEVCAVCGEIYCPGCELAAAEKVMDPILRRWFAYDCAPHEVEHYAENAAVDLSWALQDAGLLASPATSDVDDQCWICHHPYPCPTVRLCDEVDTRVKWADQLLQREVIRRKQYRAERDRLASLLREAEDRIVPDGWRVEWAFPLGFDPYPSLVPLPDTPHEEGAE